MDRTYKTRQFTHLKGLNGISDGQLEQHFKLYEGYVKNTNLIIEELAQRLAKGETEHPIFAELNRRLPFEQNGMVLHELYFDNMKPNGGQLPKGGALEKALVASFGGVEAYLKELAAISKMRGVGWALTVQDPTNGLLMNRWVTLHQDGNIAGYKPILVLDVWEHAWTVDYKPTERAKYLESWMSNVAWNVVEGRLTK